MSTKNLSTVLLLIHLFTASCVSKADKSENEISEIQTNGKQSSFSVNELMNTFEMGWDDFDNLVVSKGFGFDKLSNEKDGIYKLYLKGKDYSIVKANLNTFQKRTIGYGFPSGDEYLSCKSQLKKLGFKFIEQKELGHGNVVLNYLKNNIQAQLGTFKEGEETTYIITLIQIDLMK